MTQHRYIDYGVDATAALLKEMLTGLTGKGVLSGGELGVSGLDRIIVNPVWISLFSPRETPVGTTQNTVLLHEDQPLQLTVPITSTAASYTIIYRHTDADVNGGTRATMALEPGWVLDQNVSNGCVVGWVAYPGGAVPVAQPMLIQAPQFRVQPVNSPGQALVALPPFDLLTAHLDGPVSVFQNGIEDANAKAVFVVDNTIGTAPSREYLRWTWTVPDWPLRSISIDYVVDNNQTITLDIQDTSGYSSVSTLPGTVAVLPNMLTNDFAQDATVETYAGGTVLVKRRRVRITNGTFTPGKRFRVQATIQTAPGRRTLVTASAISGYAAPITA